MTELKKEDYEAYRTQVLAVIKQKQMNLDSDHAVLEWLHKMIKKAKPEKKGKYNFVAK